MTHSDSVHGTKTPCTERPKLRARSFQGHMPWNPRPRAARCRSVRGRRDGLQSGSAAPRGTDAHK
eukprot:1012135-Prymnesium_polylepis.1